MSLGEEYLLDNAYEIEFAHSIDDFYDKYKKKIRIPYSEFKTKYKNNVNCFADYESYDKDTKTIEIYVDKIVQQNAKEVVNIKHIDVFNA